VTREPHSLGTAPSMEHILVSKPLEHRASGPRKSLNELIMVLQRERAQSKVGPGRPG